MSAPPDSTRGLFLKARLQVIVSGAERAAEETAERWLVQLRWVAIVGMAATTLVAKLLVPSLPLAPLAGSLALVVAMNLAWQRLLSRAAPTVDDRSRFVTAQIASDVLALSLVLWFSGGTANPFAKFITFQIAIAGLLCSGRVTFGILLLTLASIGALSQAPALPLAGASLAHETVQKLGTVVSLAALSVFLGVFVYFYSKRLDLLRRESARNEKLAMLGRLVGGMSHELATPLATVLLAGKELELVTRGKDPEVEALAATVAAEAQRASDIILLMKGQVRPDQLSERVELGAFVRDFTVRELARLGFRGEVDVRAPAPVPTAVLRAGLEQVLRNVLKNAVEAQREWPGSTNRIRVDVARRGDIAEISVEDGGPGFSADILPLLGEPFQTTKELGAGMGLGLYVSAVLAERMRGELRLENPKAGGAKVTLRFSLRKVRRAGSRPADGLPWKSATSAPTKDQ